MAEMLLNEMAAGQIQAVICRAPEFYGPGKTQSITNTFVFNAIKENKKLKVPLNDIKLRSLIWTPDASRATALIGNTSDAFGQTWHLPVDNNRTTYKQLIEKASTIYGSEFKYMVVPKFVFQLGGLFSAQMHELQELLQRYEHDNIFDDSKFRRRFPDFKITSYASGIGQIMSDTLHKWEAG